ncbi:hypothetical protein [Cytobacillus oceanisediminis]|uniref:hypothetical protein n=1 Tax=Cytobacillus oceanisediminis TaxID=665099 RepID=UPI003734F99F
MVRYIKAIFTASDDPDFGEEVDTVILLAPDLVLERFDDEAGIFVLKHSLKENQSLVAIDRATCKRFEVDFLALDNPKVEELDFRWIAQAGFLQIVRAFAKVQKYI